MPAKVFLGFDLSRTLPGQAPTGSLSNIWVMPPGVHHCLDVITRDQAGFFVGPPSPATRPGRTAGSSAIGHSGGVRAYGQGTWQYGVLRSTHGIGNEVWVSLDIQWWTLTNCTHMDPNGVSQASAQCALFRWGNVTIAVKSVALILTTYLITFGIYNNGTEVDTLVVPNVVPTMWSFMKIHVKLDATTGIIEANCDGFLQTTGGAGGLTGLNTVATLALASSGTSFSADFIYVGAAGCYQDSGFVYINTYLDNVYISGDSWMSGRPTGNRLALAGTSTDSSWSAVGTGATTVSDALSASTTDAKAARGVGLGANTVLDLAAIPTAGLETNQVGIEVAVMRVSRRAPLIDRRIKTGLVVSGTSYQGNQTSSNVLPTSTTNTPPNTDYAVNGLLEQIFGDQIQLTLANLSTAKVQLQVV